MDSSAGGPLRRRRNAAKVLESTSYALAELAELIGVHRFEVLGLVLHADCFVSPIVPAEASQFCLSNGRAEPAIRVSPRFFVLLPNFGRSFSTRQLCDPVLHSLYRDLVVGGVVRGEFR